MCGDVEGRSARATASGGICSEETWKGGEPGRTEELLGRATARVHGTWGVCGDERAACNGEREVRPAEFTATGDTCRGRRAAGGEQDGGGRRVEENLEPGAEGAGSRKAGQLF